MARRRAAGRAGTLALPFLALALAGCTGAPPPGDCTLRSVAGFEHLHGLAVNPDDPELLYAATHHGLLQGNASGWASVGAAQDDLMGFTVHPTDGATAWASGHPARGGNFGVRRTTDGGCTWETVWAREWDLHAMAVSPADPQRLWGYWRGEVVRSDDGGRAWSPVGAAPPVVAFAGDPRARDVVVAASQEGLLRSEDGGATWAVANATAVPGVAFSMADGALYRGGQGRVERSTDGGRTFAPLPAALPPGEVAAYLAAHPTDGGALFVGTYTSAVYGTTDGGASWRVVKPASG